jgi:hypothetical protein
MMEKGVSSVERKTDLYCFDNLIGIGNENES